MSTLILEEGQSSEVDCELPYDEGDKLNWFKVKSTDILNCLFYYSVYFLHFWTLGFRLSELELNLVFNQ